MYQRKLIIILLFLVPTPLWSFNAIEDFSIGLGGGYTGYNTVKKEGYLQLNDPVFNFKTEIRVGLSNRSYHFDFDGIENLKANSIGILADMSFYPIGESLFGGFRWEMINISKLTNESDKILKEEGNQGITNIWSGAALMLHTGYHHTFTDRLGFKVFLQGGLYNFKFNTDINSPTEEPKTHEYWHQIYNINAALEFRFN